MGSVAEFKFCECSGRKPISLVTISLPVNNPCKTRTRMRTGYLQ
jgi:hypothetical protein